MFGLEWGATRDQIEAAFPGGKWKTLFGSSTYWVDDTRTVLNIERAKKSRLGFNLNPDGRMIGVSIEC